MKKIAFLVWSVVILSIDNLSACATCFGAPDDPMTKGMNMAIITLLGITGSVMSMVGVMIVLLRKRARVIREKLSKSLYEENKE
ncbi:MAG: hypothetical protein ACE5EE_04650 [Fidelibacterota bacterium]